MPITCFVGFDDPYATRDHALAWGQYASTTFHVHVRGATHFLVADEKAIVLETIKPALH